MSKSKSSSNKKGVVVAICIIVIVICAIVAAIIYKQSLPVISLSVNQVTIEAGDTFNPYNYLSEIKNTVSENVVVSGDVNTAVPGQYTVVYSVNGKDNASLVATVSDNVAPVIVPKSGDLVFLTDSTPVVDDLIEKVEDKTAVEIQLDTKGADLTKAGSYTVVVSATDLGQNTTIIDINITMKDPDNEAPVIDGVKDITVNVGESADLMEGVTATDNVDSDITVEADYSEVDFSAPGSYPVYYRAVDAAGNETSVSCNVVVEARNAAPEIVPLEPTYSYPYKPEGGTYSWDAAGIPNQPYLVCVNRALCTVTVYGKDANGNYTVPVKAMVCSVGREGHATPTGRYQTTARYEWTLMVDNSWGRYAIRINGGIMFHSVCYFTPSNNDLEYEEFNKLGTPASLGCVRLCLADEIWLHTNCPPGFTTIIYDDYATPGPLGKPTAPVIDVNNEATRGWDPTDPEYPF